MVLNLPNLATSKSFMSFVLHYMWIGEYFCFVVNECLRMIFPKLILRICEILINDVVIEVNMVLLKMYDVDEVLGIDCLFNH